ncbi:MAG TPA: YdeI/OmpD-associated family protein [Caldilineaceae bacterium]|nr:YdeI/OmpD-associated family protein [Caldilineaceae bacterium]
MKTVNAQTRAEWRAWLAANHGKATEVWLVYHRKETGKLSVTYGASVEEALCYGWVDSIIKKLDETSYVRKFTPRQESSNWSPSNIARVEKLIAAGLMTEYGLQKVEAAKQSGKWGNPVQGPSLTFAMLPAFAEALRQNRCAAATFANLSPTHQKQYLGWIEVAKRPATRAKRIEESIHLLAEGRQLGLK